MLGIVPLEPVENTSDRFLESMHRIAPYELLAFRNVTSDDPEAINFFQAKEKYKEGYNMCISIPSDLEETTLDQYEKEIRASSEMLVDAWLMDDRATPMTERILLLGQQYDEVLLKDVPEEKKEEYHEKYSLLFSSWILIVGYHHNNCLETISTAIEEYSDLPARVFYIRASCYFAQNDERSRNLGIRDLRRAIHRDPNFYPAYYALACVYIVLRDQVDNAIDNYTLYLNCSHPTSLDSIQSMYALSILYFNKGDKDKASDFYKQAVHAEEEFTKIYGTHTGLSSLKRAAIDLYEEPAVAADLILKCTPKKNYDKETQERIASGETQVSFPPNPNQCSACGCEDKPLMACSNCMKIWYCSRECQIADFRKIHKEKCLKQ